MATTIATTSSASERTISNGAAWAAATRPSIMNGLVNGHQGEGGDPAGVDVDQAHRAYTPIR